MLCCAVLCCAVLYCTVLYCTVLYCTVHCCLVHCSVGVFVLCLRVVVCFVVLRLVCLFRRCVVRCTSAEELRALFNSMDVDNGKELNFNEFLAATLERRKLDKRRLKLAFDRLDFDHSGTIDGTLLLIDIISDDNGYRSSNENRLMDIISNEN